MLTSPTAIGRNYKQWAEYLRQEGMDPANQLSTDDFPLVTSHTNSNLSIKSDPGAGRFRNFSGQDEPARPRPSNIAEVSRNMAERWVQLAGDGDSFFGSHLISLETWSQKYNLVWDRIVDLHVFPPSVARTESQFLPGSPE